MMENFWTIIRFTTAHTLIICKEIGIYINNMPFRLSTI